MNIWRIWSSELPEIYIEANSFDEALEKAREINPKYNTGQLQTKRNEYYQKERARYEQRLFNQNCSELVKIL